MYVLYSVFFLNAGGSTFFLDELNPSRIIFFFPPDPPLDFPLNLSSQTVILLIPSFPVVA